MHIFNRIFALRKYLVFVLFSIGPGQTLAASEVESVAWKVVVASSLSLIYITNPAKADRMFFEGGGGESVIVLRAGAIWEWEKDILKFLGNSLDTYLQFDYASWQSTKELNQQGANNSIGFNPVFRITRDTDLATIYLDTSIGIALLSNTRINGSRFGSKFQFSGLLGTGALFGNRRQWSMGYRFNHISNNAIELPNDGINFHLISISYKY